MVVVHTRLLTPGALAATCLLLSACGSSESSGASPAAGEGSSDGVRVVASFYPLQFVTERVAGDLAAVTNLTPPGAEPHDLELAASDVAALSDADLVVYESGLQAAVDDALESSSTTSYDVSEVADLDLSYEEEHAEGEAHVEGEEHAEEEHAEGEAHAEEEHAEGEEHEHEGADPHFWLDPLRLAAVGDAVADQLAEADPDHAEDYADGAASLRTDLEALDAEMEQGLASCTSTDIVTSHEAFGYLAQRYGLTQVGISGLSPDDEPTPARLAEVADFVTENQVGTIYFETLVSPDVAETVAAETGAATAVLDPIEGLTDESAGSDYLEVMRANLAALQEGQGCA